MGAWRSEGKAEAERQPQWGQPVSTAEVPGKLFYFCRHTCIHTCKETKDPPSNTSTFFFLVDVTFFKHQNWSYKEKYIIFRMFLFPKINEVPGIGHLTRVADVTLATEGMCLTYIDEQGREQDSSRRKVHSGGRTPVRLGRQTGRTWWGTPHHY